MRGRFANYIPIIFLFPKASDKSRVYLRGLTKRFNHGEKTLKTSAVGGFLAHPFSHSRDKKLREGIVGI
jgi:hypothetical protein